MSATSRSIAPAQAGSNYPRLHKATWGTKVDDYQSTRIAQKAADASARALAARAEVLRADLLLAMGNAPIAMCGNKVLTAGKTAGVGATITLASGEKVPLSSVKSIVLADGRAISPDKVITIYGGRSESDKLDVAG